MIELKLLLTIVCVTGLIGFLDAIFTKHHVWNKLNEWGSKSKYKIIFKLLSCKFCIIFHIVWIACFVLWLFLGVTYKIWAVPVVSVGLTQLFNKNGL